MLCFVVVFLATGYKRKMSLFASNERAFEVIYVDNTTSKYSRGYSEYSITVEAHNKSLFSLIERAIHEVFSMRTAYSSLLDNRNLPQRLASWQYSAALLQ